MSWCAIIGKWDQHQAKSSCIHEPPTHTLWEEEDDDDDDDELLDLKGIVFVYCSTVGSAKAIASIFFTLFHPSHLIPFSRIHLSTSVSFPLFAHPICASGEDQWTAKDDTFRTLFDHTTSQTRESTSNKNWNKQIRPLKKEKSISPFRFRTDYFYSTRCFFSLTGWLCVCVNPLYGRITSVWSFRIPAVLYELCGCANSQNGKLLLQREQSAVGFGSE